MYVLMQEYNEWSNILFILKSTYTTVGDEERLAAAATTC